MKNIKLKNVTPFIFRGEVIGRVFTFDNLDIEIITDLSGEITDYSGCGYATAKELLDNLN